MSVSKAVRAAVTLFESFREASPRILGSAKFKVPKAVAVMGYVEGIDYRTTHAGKVTLYHHDFAAGSRPLLAVSSDGLQLLLLGGRYQFTERGIVDKDARGRQILNPKHGKSINPRRKKAARHKHKWQYQGGQCPCTVKGCGKFLHPDGSISDKP